MNSVVFITNNPREERIEVFDELSRIAEFRLEVVYLRKYVFSRRWTKFFKPRHNYKIFSHFTVYKHFYLNFNVISHLKKLNPDLVIITQYSNLTYQQVMLYLSSKNIPWVFWGETPYVKYDDILFNNFFLRKILRKLLVYQIKKNALEIWPIGLIAKKSYQQLLGKQAKVLDSVPYTSNLEKFTPSPKEFSKPKILFCNSLSHRKGFDLFIQSLDILQKRDLNFSVMVVGYGEYERNLINFIENSTVDIQYLGFVEKSEIPMIYNSCDILVYPSRHDGWGMGISEGLSSGLAVISSKYVGSSNEIIKNKKNGFLIDTLDGDSIANAIEFCIKNPLETKKIASQGLIDIQKYSHTQGARTFHNLIKNLKLSN